MVVVVVEKVCVCLLRRPNRASGNADAQFGHCGFCSVCSVCHSVQVIPGTIPVEFEFHSKFRQNCVITLAGAWAKIDTSGIPGIAQIPPDLKAHTMMPTWHCLTVTTHEVVVVYTR
jgi:hypothetical protein